MEEEHATTPPADEGANLPASTPSPAPTAQGMTANTWAMIVHLSALTGYLFPIAGNIGGPLIIWIIKKDEMPEVDRHGKAALNFQISVLIYMAVAWTIVGLLCVVVVGFFLAPLLGIVSVVLTVLFPILAGMKANEGGWYDYPLTIQFIK